MSNSKTVVTWKEEEFLPQFQLLGEHEPRGLTERTAKVPVGVWERYVAAERELDEARNDMLRCFNFK